MGNILQTEFEGKQYFCGYKVVKIDMTSLGLRKNPNIMTFKLNEWIYLPEENVVEGVSDYGGIWLARTPGSARAYVRYMAREYNVKTRVFLSLVDQILFSNQGRIKTNGLRLLEEVFV